MTKISILPALFAPAALTLASCSVASTVDSDTATASDAAMDFAITEHGEFDEPWAAAIEPGSGNIFITEKGGTIKFYQPANQKLGFVSGVPEVDYGGQGGLGDIAFAPDFETSRTIYLTWAEAGSGDTRGAALGKGTLACEDHDSCEIQGLEVIWRQDKTTGRGHYSHRIAFSPDGQYLWLASGDRQKLEPAQDLTNNLGTVLRLNLDGTPAAGNPFADRGSPTDQIWSYGHRNILGMDFDAEGRLWEVEHGPAGGDELNLVKRAANYGWPTRSDGDHYNGNDIPDHTADDGFTKPAAGWTPVIAPGDMLFYRGDLFGGWQGDAIITGLRSEALVRVELDGENAREVARYPMDARLRAVVEADDGALWVLENGEGGRLLRLSPG